jgi:hypothetical protein
MPLTPDELELITCYHEHYIQHPDDLQPAQQEAMRKVLPQWHALLLRYRDEGQGSRLHVRQVDEQLAFVEGKGKELGVASPTAPAPPAVDPITPPTLPEGSHVVQAPMQDAPPQQRQQDQEQEAEAKALRERQEQEQQRRQQDQRRR